MRLFSASAAAAATLLLLAACNGRVGPQFAPVPRQMSPAGGSPTSATRARISGDFFVTGTELAGASGVTVDLGFRASLDGAALGQVTWVSLHELDVTVPAGLALGPHKLTVIAPTGLTGSLPGAWTVQTPAALSGTLALFNAAGAPATTFNVNDPISVVLTIANTGQTTATGVNGGSLGVSPGPAVQIVSGPSPGPTDIAGGRSQTFTWVVKAVLGGTIAFTASATGQDAISNATVQSTPASATATVNPVVQAVLTPSFAGSQSTRFSYVLGYQNQIWLGPAGDGSGAVSANPDGTGASVRNFQYEVDTVPNYQARNTAWVLAPPATTVGYLGCQTGTMACGPDNESGRGLFFSGVINGTEWLGLTGARDNGGTRYLYLTNPGFPRNLSGRLDFAYDDQFNGVTSSTQAAASAHVFNGAVWVGYSDSGNTGLGQPVAPVLNQLLTLPALLPGANANSTATVDLVNLRADYLPYIGANGGANANLSGSGAPPLLIDSIADFGPPGSEWLYLANNGGWLRARKLAPAPCSGPGACADWVAISPNAPGATAAASSQYAAECSVTTLKPSDFEPADKAVPYIVPFGGRLFLARNTYNANCNIVLVPLPTASFGPQLWSCNPTGANQQCGPGDWSLVAPNAAPRDANLTQMQDAGNTAITLLAAAGGYLYVGFNNGTTGVQIYRTANPAAAKHSDFAGQGDCTAGNPSCAGIGGNGLGQGATRIFDGRTLTFSGVPAVYMTAGTGTSAVTVFRVNP